jgi:hypothetical protein
VNAHACGTVLVTGSMGSYKVRAPPRVFVVGGVVLVVLGFKFSASRLLARCSTALPLRQPFFVLGIFKMGGGSLEIFVWAGLKLRSS